MSASPWPATPGSCPCCTLVAATSSTSTARSATTCCGRSPGGGVEACATVTLLDGLVLARSAFHHSVNYRSVMVFGTARRVTDPEEKRETLDVVVDHVLPGRAADSRPGNDRELGLTEVVALPLHEASAKVRTGGPNDDTEDLGLPHWAGVVPLELRAGEPVPATDLAPGIEVPAYVAAPRRPGRGPDDGPAVEADG